MKKLKEFFAKRKQAKAQKAQLEKTKKYYEILRSGAMVLQYIHKDLVKSQNAMNRHQKRRFEKELTKQGKFSPEVVEYYRNEFEKILKYIELQKAKQPKKPDVKK